MRNIGRTIFLLLAFAWSLHAGVIAYVDSPQVQSGDNITFTIESDEENTIFPTIAKIGDYPVLASPSSKSIQNINGKVSARLSQSYVFQPLKDVTIPAFEVRVNGAVVKTKPVSVTVSRRTQTLGQPYRFDIAVDKKTPYVGEEVVLTATLAIDSTYNLEGLDLFFERVDGFRVGESDKNWRGNRDGEKIVFKRTFYLYPEHSGKLEIPNTPIVGIMSDGRNRLFFNESKKFVAYSNSLDFDVKPLPKGAELVGSFALSVKTDRFKAKAGEPVNLTIMLAGQGDLENFKGFDLKIDGVTVYTDKPKNSSERKNGVLNSSASYKYALVSDANFTIPSFSITFLDPKTGEVKEVASNAVNIVVEGGAKAAPVVVQSQEKMQAAQGEEKQKIAEDQSRVGGFIWGMLFGILLGFLLPKIPGMIAKERRRTETSQSLGGKVKSAKTANLLLGHIIHYVGDPVIHPLITELESGVDTLRLKSIKKELILRLKEKGDL